MTVLLYALGLLLAFLCGVTLCGAVLAVSAMQRNAATPPTPAAPQQRRTSE